MKKSGLEQIFEFVWNAYHLPPPEREYRFAPPRRFRFDFCWPAKKVAVEIDGGNRMVRWSEKRGQYVVVGKHTKNSDYEKRNLASLLGWTVLYFTGEQLRKDPGGIVAQVRRALERNDENQTS